MGVRRRRMWGGLSLLYGQPSYRTRHAVSPHCCVSVTEGSELGLGATPVRTVVLIVAGVRGSGLRSPRPRPGSYLGSGGPGVGLESRLMADGGNGALISRAPGVSKRGSSRSNGMAGGRTCPPGSRIAQYRAGPSLSGVYWCICARERSVECSRVEPNSVRRKLKLN